jgi:GNAT superfamily N-acetyltransferase
VELRPTTVGDFPALHSLFLESIAGVYRAHAFEPPTPPFDAFVNQQRHIIETGGASVVATHAGEPLGFSSSWLRAGDWFLAFLFVDGAAQSGGVGSALLDAVWGEGALRRRTITDAIQPVSNALYARRGLVPSTPLLSFSGTPLPDNPPPHGDPPLVESDQLELAAIDAAAYGFDRAVDHTYWAGFARRTVWERAGRAVAYSYAFPSGHIGPVAGIDPGAAAAALDSELARAAGSVIVHIPGSSRLLVEVALRRGLRLSPTPGLLLLSAGAEPPTALAVAGYTLF